MEKNTHQINSNKCYIKSVWRYFIPKQSESKILSCKISFFRRTWLQRSWVPPRHVPPALRAIWSARWWSPGEIYWYGDTMRHHRCPRKMAKDGRAHRFSASTELVFWELRQAPAVDTCGPSSRNWTASGCGALEPRFGLFGRPFQSVGLCLKLMVQLHVSFPLAAFGPASVSKSQAGPRWMPSNHQMHENCLGIISLLLRQLVFRLQVQLAQLHVHFTAHPKFSPLGLRIPGHLG